MKELTAADGDKTCMYPFRDWVTCVDGCSIDVVHPHLYGNEKGMFTWLLIKNIKDIH